MKKLYVLLFFTICLFSQSIAQNINDLDPIKPKKWKITQIDIATGLDWATYDNISLTSVMRVAKNPEELQRNLQNLSEEVNNTTAGIGLHGSISLSPFSAAKDDYLRNQELRLGVVLYSPKEAMVSYKNEALDTSITFCNVQGEFALEGAYLFKGSWKKQRLLWSIGGGTNAGLTFANEMVVMSGQYLKPGEHPSELKSTVEEKYDAKAVYYLRAYIPFGLHYQVNENVALGMEGRFVRGIQRIAGERPNVMSSAGAFLLSMKYLFD